MIDSSSFKKGDCLVFKGAPMTIVDVTFSTPTARGGGTIARTRLRNLLTGQILNESIRCGERFDEVDLEQHPCTYMYSDGKLWHFMDSTSYEQFSLSADELGSATKFLKDGQEELRVTLIDGKIAGVVLPNTVALEVVECDPVIKGATATSVTKTAVLETGLNLQVPPYLSRGEVIRVDTRDGHFVSRA